MTWHTNPFITYLFRSGFGHGSLGFDIYSTRHLPRALDCIWLSDGILSQIQDDFTPILIICVSSASLSGQVLAFITLVQFWTAKKSSQDYALGLNTELAKPKCWKDC